MTKHLRNRDSLREPYIQHMILASAMTQLDRSWHTTENVLTSARSAHAWPSGQAWKPCNTR